MTPSARSPSSSGFPHDGAFCYDSVDIVPSQPAVPMEGVSTLPTVDSPNPKNPEKSYRSHDDAPSMTDEPRDAKERSARSIKDTSRRQPEKRLIHDGGDRVEEALLPPKKRATSDSNGHSSHSDDSSAPPKKRRIYYIDTGSKDGGTSETPVPRHHVDAAGNTAGSPNPAEEAALSEAENLRLLKGKMIATEESSSASMAIATVTSEPPQEKLMHDGIRSGVRFDEYLLQMPRRHRSACNGAPASNSGSRRLMEEGETYACNVASGSANGSPRLMEEGEAYAAAAAPEKKKKKKKKNKVDACSGVPPARGIPFDKVRTSMALRDRLEELRATEPEYVCEKMLQKSDVCRNQNRLLFSCKRKELASCPITWLFTKKEMRRIEDKWQGLEVTVFDRRGNKYEIRCKYLDSNGGYRFITKWGEFLDHNGMYLHPHGKWTRHVDVELWAFRSWRLPKLPDGEETGHPDGSLGLILLHYEGRRRNVDGAEEKWKRALPVHQTKMEHMASASASAVVKKEKLADAGAEQREAGTRGITREDMAATVGQDTLGAAIGILKLTRCQVADKILLSSLHSSSSSKYK